MDKVHFEKRDRALCARPYVFVSGKGGVGKSLVAAALAKGTAESGRKTLLVETGARSYYKDFLELETVDHTPRPSGMGFDVALWSGESCLREYVLHLLKLERLYKLFFENKVMHALVSVAPGLSEIAVLGKITSEVRHVGPAFHYETVIVDMPATGHAMAMLRAPKGMAEAIQIGPIAQHSREMHRILCDPTMVALVAVSLLEELPVQETTEFVDEFFREFPIPVHIVANRKLELEISDSDMTALVESLSDPELSVLRRFSSGVRDQTRAQNETEIRLSKIVSTGKAKGVHSVPRFYAKAPIAMIDEAKEALQILWRV